MAPKQQMRVDRQARATAHNAKRKYHEIKASILPACLAYAELESCSMGLGWRRTKGGLLHTTLFFLTLTAQAMAVAAWKWLVHPAPVFEDDDDDERHRVHLIRVHAAFQETNRMNNGASSMGSVAAAFILLMGHLPANARRSVATQRIIDNLRILLFSRVRWDCGSS